MAGTLTEKIIKSHLLEGEMEPGKEICLKVDQCLLQDATGTLAFLEFEQMGVKKVKPEFCIQYVDHNMLQEDYKNADDHIFLQTISSKHGVYFSRPGNGICHHIHTERFTKPGKVLIGADSHTATAASGSMLAIGTGGLEVATGMATGKFYVKMPKILGIKLTGRLKPWCTAKDVILEVLRRIDVTGGLGKVLEYYGDGVKTLAVPERATIGNMGAETGATSSMFPSDERTKEFFMAQKRVGDFKPLEADKDAEYDETIEINLDEIEPLIACPFSPGNVKPVREVAGLEAQQAMIGSSTNSSYKDLMVAAKVLEGGRKTHYRTSFHVIPGSRQTLETIARDNGLLSLLKAGARIAEPSCNACIGMGNAPAWDTVSVRSFNRNWQGRSGTEKDNVFLSSPETALATAITRKITDPRDLGVPYPKLEWPKEYIIDDSMILKPEFKDEIKRGPNIKPLPELKPLAENSVGHVYIKVGDNISTDHIMPAGADVLPLRSNIDAISEYVFRFLDKDIVKRAKEWKKGFIVGGSNYGQGSSREHAALAPKYLGVQAVLAKSFARIHKANLTNFCVLPLEFVNAGDYDNISQGDELEIPDVRKILSKNEAILIVKNKTKKREYEVKHDLTERQIKLLMAGGLLNYIKNGVK